MQFEAVSPAAKAIEPWRTTIPRRGFLKATTLGGAALASGLSDASVSLAKAQNAAQPAAANPRVRPADIVLKNGKIITVDSAFSVTQAIARSPAIGLSQSVRMLRWWRIPARKRAWST